VAIFRGSIVSDRPIGQARMDEVLSDILHGPKSVAAAA
jgi:hypothetical protein